MRTVLILSAVLLVGMSAAHAARDYYKWTDESGVTHYSARKPHNREAEVISVRTGQPVATTPASTPRNSTSQDPRTASTGETDTSLKDPERCETARNNLETLRNNAKVRMKDESGEIHYLSEEEKAEKIREFEEAARESC